MRGIQSHGREGSRVLCKLKWFTPGFGRHACRGCVSDSQLGAVGRRRPMTERPRADHTRLTGTLSCRLLGRTRFEGTPVIQSMHVP